MTHLVTRRAATLVATAALALAAVGAGSGIASAAGSSMPGTGSTSTPGEVTTQPTTATKQTSNIKVQRSVSAGFVAPGQKVTYTTTFTTTAIPDRYIARIRDVPPTGFTYVPNSATVDAWHLVGGQKTESVPVTVDNDGTVLVQNSGGWLISPISNKALTLSVTYYVPQNAPIGTTYDSGVTFDVNTFATGQIMNPMGVFTTVRNSSPGEASGTGSTALGLGSSNGFAPIPGSSVIDNPQGFLAGIINQVIKDQTGS